MLLMETLVSLVMEGERICVNAIFPISSVEINVSQFVEKGDPMREKFGFWALLFSIFHSPDRRSLGENSWSTLARISIWRFKAGPVFT